MFNWKVYFAALILWVIIIASCNTAFAVGYGPSKFYGPYNAEVVRVIDGDSIKVIAEIFPHIEANLNVRLEGIDTPELRGKCEKEKQLARAAKAFVEAQFPASGNPWVLLRNVRDDKYSGRVVATVHITKTETLNQMLLDSGHAVVYTGRGKRKDWCNG